MLCGLYQFMAAWLAAATLHFFIVNTIPYVRRIFYATKLTQSLKAIQGLDGVACIGDMFFLAEIRLQCHYSIFKHLYDKIVEHRKQAIDLTVSAKKNGTKNDSDGLEEESTIIEMKEFAT